MRIILTGGAGDLGRILCPLLQSEQHTVVVFDPLKAGSTSVEHIEGSIEDRTALKSAFANADLIVHIAAWHGIHDFRRQRNVYEFWDLNVTGTFNVFQAAVEARINKLIFLSSTSIDDRYGIYGHTKVLGEEIARTYAGRHGMNVVSLRPRAFIPHWNRSVYNSYVDWARWYWSGAVHIQDVAHSVRDSVRYLSSVDKMDGAVSLTIDGAYEYQDQDLATWDIDGPGSTFRRYYAQYADLAATHGLNIEQKPKKLDISRTMALINYQPTFSLKSLLMELETYGVDGPPAP